ncbi:MAG: bL27 family ribosomal protein [bacterium]|nr:bL27 family ribosomal protein [bacterium]
MAHKKAAGSAKNLRDSNPKYRGVKLFGGQFARAGNIIVRQKGDTYHLGKNVYKGRDFTIHAAVDGVVYFRKKNVAKYNGRIYLETTVDILPIEQQASSSDKVATKTAKAKKPTATAATTKTVEKKEKKTPSKKPVAKKSAAKKTTSIKTTEKAAVKAVTTKKTVKAATPTKKKTMKTKPTATKKTTSPKKTTSTAKTSVPKKTSPKKAPPKK